MDIEAIKKLRALTNIGYQNCREALEATNYNLESAVNWLREKGSLKNKELIGEKKIGIVQISQKENKIVAFILNCQTDFVALSEKFREVTQKIANKLLDNFSNFYQTNSFQLSTETNNLINELSLATGERIALNDCHFLLKSTQEKFGFYLHHNKQMGAVVLIEGETEEEVANELALQLAANKPQFLSLEKIPQDVLEKNKEEFIKEAMRENPNKPKEIIERIAQGKLQKYLSSICFLEQVDFRNPEVKIKDYLIKKQVKINDFRLLSLTESKK